MVLPGVFMVNDCAKAAFNLTEVKRR